MLELFSLVKYCNITLFRYTLQISFKDGLCNVFLFSSHLAFFSLFSFQGTMLDAGLWILDSGYLFPYSLHPFEFLKLKVQYSIFIEY